MFKQMKFSVKLIAQAFATREGFFYFFRLINVNRLFPFISNI